MLDATYLQELRTCTDCPLHETATQTVRGNGNVPCDIMLVGEAPGGEEDRVGRPFVGRSGLRLDSLFDHAGIDRWAEVFVTNLVKHRPPGNRRPHKKAEIAVCAKWLEIEIAAVKPRIIVAMGATAVQYFLPKAKLSKDHGLPHELGDYIVVPMYHPAATFYNANLLPALYQDFERLGELVRRGVPPKQQEPAYNLSDHHLASTASYFYGVVGFDLETTSPMRRRWFAADEAEIVGYSVAWEPYQGVYIGDAPNLQMKEALENPSVVVICHNTKFEYARLQQMGITLTNFHDTKLAAMLLQYPDTSLKSLARQVLGADPITYEQVTDGRDMADIPPEEIMPYAAADADHPFRLWDIFEPLLKSEGLWQLYQTELDLIPVVADMEIHGIAVDEEAALALIEEWEALREVEQPWLMEALGVENPGSTQQVAIALERMGFPLTDRTPAKGLFVVDDDKLLSVRWFHTELVDRLLNFRRLGKLLSYLRNFIVLRAPDGRLHPGVQQAGAFEEGRSKGGEAPATGRLSYSGPNLQNIPHRGDAGRVKAIRDCLVASPGMVLLAADASQEEARILAFVGKEPQMLADFASGNPIYSFVGESLYDRPITKKGDPKEWFVAKTYFLAKMYGCNYSKLLEIDSTMSISQAMKAANRLDRRYKRLRAYHKEVNKELYDHYRVTDYFGRHRDFPKAGSDNWVDRGQAEREAFNFKMQGPAGTVIKVAMRRIWEELEQYGAHILLSIHDEVVLEVPPDQVDNVARLCYNSFQGILPIDLPIEFQIGERWGSLESYEIGGI